MPRITLKPLDSYKFRCDLTARVSDINYGGHVGNSQMAGLVHESRVILLRENGMSEIDLGDGKTGIIQLDLVINFKAEAFLGDKLTVESEITETDTSSFRICNKISKEGKPVAIAEAGFASFNYAERRIVPLPENFFIKLGITQRG